MAPKRPTPKKPVARKPQPAAKPVAEPVMRRAQPVAAPSAAESIAEREPAVLVAPSVAEIAAQAEADAWAVPPRQLTWWERISAVIPFLPVRKTTQTEGMAEHMAAVKAGVLQELETMGAKKGVALKGSPFSTVMLPTARRKRNYKWPLVGLAVVLLVAVIVWIGRQPADPAKVLGQAIAAVKTQDVRSFEARVDVASVATSVVNQLLNVPEAGNGLMAAKMTAFVKPGLAEALKDEVLVAVGGEALDDSGNTLLGKLWHALGGENARFGVPHVAQQDDRLAVAELPLMRPDLSLNLPLQVVLTQTVAQDGWQVVDVPNLADVLTTIADAERMRDERRAAAATGRPPRVLWWKQLRRPKMVIRGTTT